MKPDEKKPGQELSFELYSKTIKLGTKLLQDEGIPCSTTVSGLTLAFCMHLMDLSTNTGAVADLLKEISETMRNIATEEDNKKELH